VLVTNISSPSLGNFATPARLFFLLKKFGSARQQPNASKIICLLRPRSKKPLESGFYCAG
jgi:hypothetical protein